MFDTSKVKQIACSKELILTGTYALVKINLSFPQANPNFTHSLNK